MGQGQAGSREGILEEVVPKTRCEQDTGESCELPKEVAGTAGHTNTTTGARHMAASPRCTQARPHSTNPRHRPPWPWSSRPGPLFWGPRLSLPPDTAVLTSVCALGSPALAFSRISSKGVSMSPFTGPLRGKTMSRSLLSLGRGREDSTNGRTWSTSRRNPGREVREDSHDAPQGGREHSSWAVSSGSARLWVCGEDGPTDPSPSPPSAHCLTAVLGGPTSIPNLHPDAQHPQTEGTIPEIAV